MACLRHTGENYNTDKESVYSLLVEYAKDSEIKSIVEQFKDTRNGRAAWNAILRHMQSTSYLDTLKTDALASIKSAHYIGEKKDFGMTKHYAIHSTAHNNLDTAGEPMSDGMKITHFCNGLKDSIAIHYAITTKSDPNVNTFEEFYNSFSAKLTSHITLTKATATNNSNRSISAVGHGGRGRGGRGSRGRGRGRYGSYRGRGRGRGGGRGRSYSGFCSSYTPWAPEARDYPDEEWHDLTWNQQQRVRDLRRAMNSQRSNEESHAPSDERQINATESATREAGSIPGEVSVGGGSVPSTQGRAGDAFAPASRGSNSGGRSRGFHN